MENKKESILNGVLVKFVGLVMAIFVFVTIFSSVLNVMSFNKITNEVYSNASRLSVTGPLNNIKYSVSFGKPIEKFFGMKSILDDTLSMSTDFLSVSIVNKNNEVLYSSGQEILKVPKDILQEEYVEAKEGIYTSCSINDNSSLVILLDKSYVDSRVKNYISSIIKIDIILAVSVFVLTLLIYFMLLSVKKKIKFSDLKISAIVILIISQLTFGAVVMNYYTQGYTQSISKIAEGISQTVKNDIKSIIDQGIPIEEFTGLDEYLTSIVNDVPEIENVYITTHKVGDSYMTKLISNDKIYYINIDSKVDQKVINNRIIQFSIDAAILIAITVLLCLELSLFLGESADEEKKKLRKQSGRRISISGLRLFFFVSLLTLSLDSGFISIVSNNLFKNLNDQSLPSFISGLPVTVGIIATMIGIAFWSKIMSKIGIKLLLIFGVIFSSAGLFISSLSNNLYYFSLARFIYGFGFAAILATTKVFSSLHDDIKERTKISSALTVGTLAGSSCGVVIGGLVADRTSYNFVFIMAAVLSILTLLLIPIINIDKTVNIPKFSFNKLGSILKQKAIILYILLIIIPVYISSMFVGYSIPLYGDEINLSQTTISAIIMMNYIVTAYLTNSMSNISMNYFSVKKLTFIYVITLSLSVALFSLFNNLLTAIISTILLAIADSFGLIAIIETFYEVLGKDVNRTMGAMLFVMVSKLGSGIAPTLISSQLSQGIAKASLIIPYTLLGGIALYLLLSRGKKQNQI